MKSLSLFPWIACTAMLLSGCAAGFNLQPEPDPTRYYLLALDPPANVNPEEGTLVGLQRIQLPSYIQTQRIALRSMNHELHYSEIHRWGERIDYALSRLLVEQLPGEGIRRVEAVPWASPDGIDLFLELRVNRFDGTKNGEVVLDVNWKLRPPRGESLGNGRFVTVGSWDGVNYNDFAAAMSHAVAELIHELRVEIHAAAFPESRSERVGS